MTEVVTAYKVVDVRMGEIRSFVRENPYATTYRIGHTCYGDVGPLMCFEDLLSAVLFIPPCTRGNKEIFKSEVVLSDLSPSFVLRHLITSLLVDNFWHRAREGEWGERGGGSGLLRPPKGTIFCDSVRLVEKVGEGEIRGLMEVLEKEKEITS